MNFNNVKFDIAVDEFKKLCPGHLEMIRFGQFYVMNRTIDDLLSQIEAYLQNIPRFFNQPDKLKGAMDFFRDRLKSVGVMDVNVPGIMAMLDLLDQGGDMAPIRAWCKLAVTPADVARNLAYAKADFEALWDRSDIPAAPLMSSSLPTLAKAQAAFEFEKDKCYRVLMSFARMALKKRGVAALLPARVLHVNQVGGAVRQVTAAATNTEVAQETIQYNAPAALFAAAGKMTDALDDGGFVRCGLLSGADHDKRPFPKPEHHILVISWSVIGGHNAFLFWDPDAGRSNIASVVSSLDKKPWGRGFGVLFSRPGRLCTAFDDADLTAIDRHGWHGNTPPTPTFGDHLNDPLRHCYQAYELQTLPIPVQVRVHTKVLTPPAHASIDDMLYNATDLYAAYGIELVEVSREILDTPETDLEKFQTLFVGEGRTGEPTADVTELHETLRAAGRESGSDPQATDIVIVFVRTLVPATVGCSSHPLEKPGAVLSATLADEWSLAHQIGHVLGLPHVVDDNRLMFPSTGALATLPPVLSDDDVVTILASPLVQV